MRQIGIKELRVQMTSAFKDLPFEVTLAGKVIAVVMSYDAVKMLWKLPEGEKMPDDYKQDFTAPEHEDQKISTPPVKQVKKVEPVLKEYKSQSSNAVPRGSFQPARWYK